MDSRKNLILLYYSSTCLYSFGGNSALWQFEAAAQFFKSNQYLLFAKVDVSKMDLPWHLRVENVPCIIFFPANRSSYSSVFPMEAISSTNLFTQLVTFIYEKINSDENNESGEMNRFQNSSQFAAMLTSQLLESIDIKPSEELMQPVLEAHRICSAQILSYSKDLCFSGVQKAVSIKAHDYHNINVTSTKMLSTIEKKLNKLNDRLVRDSFLLLLSSNVQKHLSQSIKIHSKLWHIINKLNSQIVKKLKILSNYSYFQL
ncbi:unnamed protein product [Heterobilharzia americana]|nr:unnamed protein product [Heterobilharzia americana]